MKFEYKITVTVLIICTIITFFKLWDSPKKNNGSTINYITSEMVQKVNIGDSIDSLKKVLGEPLGISENSNFWYSSKNETWVIQIKNNKVQSVTLFDSNKPKEN